MKNESTAQLLGSTDARNAVEAFFGLMRGENTGKMVVRVSPAA